MKILKYVAAAVAAVAMTFSFSSCSRDLDPDVDAKGWYRCEITLANAGSLSEEGQQAFSDAVDAAYGIDKGTAHPFSYVTKAYMQNAFNTIVALPASESDIIQKVIIPVAQSQGVKDFTVKFALQEQKTTTNADGEEVKDVTDLQSVEYRAADYAN